ncbi:MAG: hypothetical protein MZV65_18870 [Chromatiales bacterium]|nr:hypothetical protein [Chromatiales bacterium]
MLEPARRSARALPGRIGLETAPDRRRRAAHPRAASTRCGGDVFRHRPLLGGWLATSAARCCCGAPCAP